MALVANTLEKDVLSAYQSMSDGSNKVFSEKLSAAVKKFAESGSITTADVGGVSVGAFTGAGTGKIKVDDSICEKIVYAACEAMNNMSSGGNAYLSAQLALGIHTMILAGEVDTDVKGTVVTPSGASTALSGKAKGTMTGVPAPMQATFTAAFNSMDSMTSGGDEYLAKQISIGVDTYLKVAVIKTNGSGALSGSIGTGKMT